MPASFRTKIIIANIMDTHKTSKDYIVEVKLKNKYRYLIQDYYYY